MQERSLSEYMNLDEKIRREKKAQKKIKIALLGSFTLNGFKETLNVKCHEAGIKPEFYIGEYNQYIQILTDKNNGFYRFRPDVTFLLVDARSLLGELYFDPYGISEKNRRDIAQDNYKKLNSIIGNFTKNPSGILVMNNFEIPTYSPIGILESKQRFGYFDMIRELNRQITRFSKHPSVFIFDYDSFVSGIGKKNAVDDKLLYLADMKISPEAVPLLCEEYVRYIRASKGLMRKCIVLDMDNTLWGGIVGEDGIEGIKLGPTPPGNAYMEFQKRILALFQRGVILAINSNNNREDAIKVLREHPHMVLRERHFASLKINWENKVKNLLEISKEINIGLDSMVFLDDDRRMRQVVKEALPEVLCPDVPEDASHYASFLAELKSIDTLQITHEDRKRGRLYASERRRKESATAFKDISQYLRHLNIVVEIKPADKFSIPRISQLTLRTNQFNFSTKRYEEKTIEGFTKDRRYDAYYVRVKDRYGDYGITSVVIVRKDRKAWLIDTFLLSCRILGKGIEKAVLSYIVRKAQGKGIRRVAIEYRKSEKNASVLEFLKNHGIKIKEDFDILTLYQKGKKPKITQSVKHIKVISQ